MASRRPRSLSLRAKIVLILSAVVVAYAVSDHLIQQLLVQRSFVALEEARAMREVRRVLAAVDSETEHLALRCDEWAARKDVWDFVTGGDPGFERRNLTDEALGRSGLDLILLCGDGDDRHAPVLWRRVRGPRGEQLELRDFPSGALPREHPLLAAREPGPGQPARPGPTGIVMTEAGPMIAASRPIRAAGGDGAPGGTVIVGRFLGGEMIELLVGRTLVDISLWTLGDPALPAPEREVFAELRGSFGPVIRIREDQPIHVYATLQDVRKVPVVLARIDVAREISARGAEATRWALLSTFAAGVVILLVLLLVLQRTVIEPLQRLTEHAVEIGRSEDFSRKLGLGRDDEIGILSREFDAMMDKLAQSRAAVVKAARAAGMSEIATGVLHNVGNVLNSVNVSASLVADRTRRSATQDLKRAIDLVDESAGDLSSFLERDPRGRHLYPLLRTLTDRLAEEQRSIGLEIESLSEGIGHIKDLIHSQQDYAGRSGVLEIVRLDEQVDAALAITAQTVRGASIEVERDYAELEPMPVDRHRLMEILVNLTQNARQALQAPDLAQRKLRVRVAPTARDGVLVEVSDTGVGIHPENLARVFTHGFTTKRTGHGFGLHSSANAAREMGGKLWAESEGVGRGATFVLELPIRRQALAEVGR